MPEDACADLLPRIFALLRDRPSDAESVLVPSHGKRVLHLGAGQSGADIPSPENAKFRSSSDPRCSKVLKMMRFCCDNALQVIIHELSCIQLWTALSVQPAEFLLVMPIHVLDDLRHVHHCLSFAFGSVRIAALMRRERRTPFEARPDDTEISVDLDMTVDAFKAEHDRYQVL